MKIATKLVAALGIVAMGQLAAFYIVWVGTGQWLSHFYDMGLLCFVFLVLSMLAAYAALA